MAHSPRRVAIACQGGGAHTAFTAGVLDRLLAPDWPGEQEIVALSGTSGGAVCAALAWSGLVREGKEEARRALGAFWDELEARGWWDAAANAWGLWYARLPVSWELSPYDLPSSAEERLTDMLARHLRLGALPPGPAARQRPFLRIGAADVLQGEARVFRGETLEVRQLVASAAVPPLYRAIPLDGSFCWDGLYSQNPPIRELLQLEAEDGEDRNPDEIWVVRINPLGRGALPRTADEIEDRRNEMAGNLSLEQELRFVRKINELRGASAELAARYRHVEIRMVEMDLLGDYASKLDRSPEWLRRLRDRGRELAPLFLGEGSLHPRSGP